MSTPSLRIVMQRRHLGHTPKSECTLNFVPKTPHLPQVYPQLCFLTPQRKLAIHSQLLSQDLVRQLSHSTIFFFFLNEEYALLLNVSKELIRSSFKNGWL